jgi:uncharacterized membrane protein YkoI
MRRRQLLFLAFLGLAQLATAPGALAKDGEDDGDDHDSDHVSDDSDDDSSDDHGDDGGSDDSGDDKGGDDSGGDDEEGGDDSSGGHDDRDDHDRAYDAVSSGKAVPLKQVLASFATQFGGTVVDVKLVLGSTLRYRIRFVDRAGRVRHVYYDATNGKLLR